MEDHGEPTRQFPHRDLRISSKEPSGSDVLTLDIGGEKTIKSLRSTLTMVPGSKLAELFSGRWDDSLPQNELGHFFIDCNPEIFLPLRDYLCSLSSMAPGDSSLDCLPPITPSFMDPKEEAMFRRLVDGYDLTNVLYNYEIYRFGKSVSIWNSRTKVSRASAIFDVAMEWDTEKSPCFCLDRPAQSLLDPHTRRVEAFEIVRQGLAMLLIGWVRRGTIFTRDIKTLHASIDRVLFDLRDNTLFFYDRQGDPHKSDPVSGAFDEDTVFRCSRSRVSGELEWYADSVLIAATSRAFDRGGKQTIDNVCRIGWSSSNDNEMIPFVQVISGCCRFSALELDTYSH